MKRHWRWLVVAAVTVISFLLCCVGGAAALGLLPPSQIIAQQYLDAVTRKDNQSAIDLANSEPFCETAVKEDVKKDISQFGGAEIRNVSISVAGGTGSSDTVQFASIQFEYRKASSHAWERGEMRLMTDSNLTIFRRLCGNLEYHGP